MNNELLKLRSGLLRKHIFKHMLNVKCCLLNDSGQVVLLLVLVTVVGLTIGLSLISRTVTDVRISSQIEQSGRAFTAAESGVETALQGINVGQLNPAGTIDIPGSGSTATYKVSFLGGSSALLISPLIEAEESQTIWFTAHDTQSRNLTFPYTNYNTAPNFDICWGSNAGDIEPAVELTMYYYVNPPPPVVPGTEYRIAKLAYDSDPVRRSGSSGNNFSASDPTGNYCGGGFRFRKTITTVTTVGMDNFGMAMTDNPLVLKVKALYNNTKIAIQPNNDSFSLPVQGDVITSVGQTSTGVARKIQVINGFKTLPALMDFTLFTENE